jgi:putative FmdB family regulatory protein
MPIYAYRCADCGRACDVLQKLSDAPLTQCPACGAQALRKQVTAAGFQLKGSGWYVTDFKGGAAPAEKSGDKPADKGGEKGGEPAASGTADKPAADKSTAAAPAPAAAAPVAAPSTPAAKPTASGTGQ